ncbi:aminotransferase class V-fold PLP-dependent enzyme [Aeoliella sp.]|uniref:aminotransferase class V-fold PLP-dependent enzyme n=1 Tax=Aeoliella sp. TaxID=2795800 RepID=UPI003CCB7CE2
MTPGAQDVHCDFSRFVGEVGASILFTDFLWHGLEACPAELAERFPALLAWKGVTALKQELCNLTTLPTRTRALLAGRSAQLMKMAATLLYRPCRNVLVTDLGWPPYHTILDGESRRMNRRRTTVKLQRELPTSELDQEEIVERIRAAYIVHHCDGLFLTAVSHLGVRLPVQEIVQAIAQSAELRFVVVDGAQDFCHVDSDLQGDCADLYLAGAHKWLGSFHPLGLAFYGKRRSRDLVETVLQDNLDCGNLDDPLLRFMNSGNTSESGCPEETVNLAGLFSCQGAVSDATMLVADKARQFASRLANARAIAEMAESLGWSSEMPRQPLQCGILLLQSRSERIRSLPAESLRSRFYQHGIALTGYDQGRVRLSMPGDRLNEEDLNSIRTALTGVA